MGELSPWTHFGGDVTEVKGLCEPDTDVNDWYLRVVRFISRISRTNQFEVVDNGYVTHPEMLALGIKAFFKGERFGIEADDPGELYIHHSEMGSRRANELIERLGVLWDRVESDRP